MPRPQTGQFRQPGSSLPGYIPPLTTRDLAAQVDELAHHATVRRNDHAALALQALSGTDPVLYPVSSTARARVLGLLRKHAAETARQRADPRRRFFNRLGIEADDAGLRAVQQKELAALEAEVTSQLDEITAGLAAKLQALRSQDVTDDEMREAHMLADRLRRLTPEIGLGEIMEFFDQVGTGQRPRAELVALLPILESAYQTPGSPVAGQEQLRRLMAIGESLLDGGWQASVVETRLERAGRLRGEVATVFYLAKTDPTAAALTAHVTGDQPDPAFYGGDPERRDGDYALLAEQLPPDGPAPEDREDWRDAEPKPFRRIAAGTITAEQRAADEAARLAAEE
jgi:hypothetical protein